MKDQSGEIDLKELERQLSCPTGAVGLEVARNMHENNLGMTVNTIDFLDLRDSHAVLELGHGNCNHLSILIEKARNLRYQGLELSETMYEEAQRCNANLMRRHDISFTLYDGNRIPFDDHTFDRIMTVNTIYFWKNPEAFIQEIARVLKPDGRAVISYVQKEFMKKLPFIGDVFRLYDDNDVRALVDKSSRKLIEIAARTESVKTRTGELVTRPYAMAAVG